MRNGPKFALWERGGASQVSDFQLYLPSLLVLNTLIHFLSFPALFLACLFLSWWLSSSSFPIQYVMFFPKESELPYTNKMVSVIIPFTQLLYRCICRAPQHSLSPFKKYLVQDSDRSAKIEEMAHGFNLWFSSRQTAAKGWAPHTYVSLSTSP